MDLLNQNYNTKPERTKGTKIVITLLIICIISVIAIIALMIYLRATQGAIKTVQVNGTVIQYEQDFIISDSVGNDYVSLKDLSGILGYQYNNGEFQKYEEDRTKCYITKANEIVGFSVDSSVIYKTKENSKTDYEYYNLDNNIIMYQDKLYIAMQDLAKALNIIYSISDGNVITINTPENIAIAHSEQLKNSNYTLSTEVNNLKSIPYGMLVVSRDNLWGVLNTNYQEIIGNKYRTMQFDEYNMNYIVSNERNQYGIITTDGSVKIALKYDSLEVINYEPLLYKVSRNKKYGIMKKDGTMLTELEYDKIGYDAEPQNKINNTLIIPDLDGKTGKTIVVYKNNKYGLIYLNDGKTFIECDIIDKIYELEELGELKYRVEIQGKTYALEDYIEYVRTQTMVVN